MNKPNIDHMADVITKHIKEETKATTNFVKEVELLLNDLPESIGGERKIRLKAQCEAYLRRNE